MRIEQAAVAGHMRSREIVAAVRSCIGTRFRSQGRTPGLALDCVGVVLVAARAAGMVMPMVPFYQLGGDNEAGLDAFIVAAGLRRVAAAAPGDVELFAPAPGCRHLAVHVNVPQFARNPQLVHAHAGIGRVVESSADAAWCSLGIFRFPERC